MSAGDPRDHAARNPFHVLGLPPGASRAEIEREGQRLLDALALGLDEAGSCPTPFGPRPRGPEEIRDALAELRDPERRILHEIFAAAPCAAEPPSAVPGWPQAFAAMGWRERP